MKYIVKIEEKDYEVEIIDLYARPIVAVVDGTPIEVSPVTEGQPVAPIHAHPTAQRPAAFSVNSVPTPITPIPSAVAQAGNIVRAPIPGVILTVFVKPGESVHRGQELFIIEAMKMKNTIRSVRDGVIAEVLVAPGTTVNHNAPIVSYVEA